MVQYRPDFMVRDRAGSLAAIVQVKDLGDADQETAGLYMRSLLQYGKMPRACYVLLITRATGYLWSTPAVVAQGALPLLTFPMAAIAKHYLPSADLSSDYGDLVLDSIVRAWLWGLVDGRSVDEAVTSDLREAGLLDEVRDGEIAEPALV